MQWEIGLELSDTCVRVATRARGVILSIPSLAATRGGEALFTGEDALAMLGRAPEGMELARPISSGRIANAALASLWIEKLLGNYAGRVKRSAVALAVPPEMPPNDRALLAESVMRADAASCGVMRSDLAALLGAGRDAMSPEGVLVVDAGAGAIGASIISYGRVVARRALDYGMRRVDEDIASVVRERRAFSVGPHTAEEIKLQLGSAIPGRALYVKAAGLDQKTGFPAEAEVDAADVEAAVVPMAEAIAALAVSVIQLAPGDLATDLIETGAILTGGGARLFGLDRLIQLRTRLRVAIPEDPAGCVIRGLHRALVEDAEGMYIKAV